MLPFPRSGGCDQSSESLPVLVVDLGGQYSQLIARRVREARVYSELVGHRSTAAALRARNPAALILSGGPASVYAEDAPQVDPGIYELGVPVLGICYGMQLMAQDLGGRVERTGASEFGKTAFRVAGALAAGLPEEQTAWMSHRDSVTAPPEGAAVTGGSESTPIAAFEAPERGLYGVQFHPEVVHTPHGAGGPEELPLRRRRRAADLDAGGRDRGAGRAHPRAGRQGARALRALRRRRLRGRRAARAQGGRRPAHLRLRRPRPAPQGRGGAGGRDVRGPLPRPARPCRRG